ncbi:tail fiber domain-containing protein [Dyadobacter sp. CY107]|uniref:tail fiber domain-containing protein n=1 Tax=Dyadobacter fanqingshengii TaxID=2906443 RepID=UPI001F281FD9|nr:tail fiber domain-containing protein [Dyadobacter fanqingshengii]MCF2505092.1 tail fiber domain-containing protein [Dyadobacter fanqingshengii]
MDNLCVQDKTEKRLLILAILLIAIVLLLLSFATSAQVPQQFSFQGVARDAGGKVIANAMVKLRLTIHKATPSGPSNFEEQHDAQTNSAGIFNVKVGGAGGDLGGVDWKSDTYFLQVELDPDGGTDFMDLGATQLLSVPYALHAEEAGRLKNDDPVVLSGSLGSGKGLSTIGNGSRFIWYPGKASLRAGISGNGSWEDVKIGENSVGLGNAVEASGQNSIAFGYLSKAVSKNSIAIGDHASGVGVGSLAIGYEAEATGNGAIVFGTQSKATDLSSVAIGSLNEASGSGSIVLGSRSVAAGIQASTLGKSLVAKAVRGMALGAFNSNSDSPNSNTENPLDRIFQIGIGVSENSRANAMTILRNGQVGIGSKVLDPQFLLDLGGRARIRHNGETAGIYFNNSLNTSDGFVGMKTDNEIGLFLKDWKFWVTAQGNGYLNGNLIQTSDRRLKTNILPFENSIEKVSSLQGYHYNWEDKTKDQTLQTGLIAQEVEQVFPELVSTNKDGFKSVNYIGLVPHLIESVKELKGKTDGIAALRVELEAKTNEISALRKELEDVRQLGQRLELLEASVSKEFGSIKTKTAK